MRDTVFNHKRTKLLAYDLGVPLCTAAGLVCGLWDYAESEDSDGTLSNGQGYAMLAHVGWKHPDGKDILESLLLSGWMRALEGNAAPSFLLADWEQIQSDRLRDRLRKRAKRTTDTTDTNQGPGPPRRTFPPKPQETTDESTKNQQHHGTCPPKGEGGEGGVGVSENGAQGEGYRLQTEEAKPPKKRTKPITADQVQIPPEMDRPGVVSALEEWLVYKRKRGQAYKDPAYVTKLLSQFIDDPPGVFEASVDYTIGQHWSGLFRPGNRPTPRDTNQTRRPLAANAWDQAEKELSP